MQGAQQRHHRHHLHAQGTSSEIQRKHGETVAQNTKEDLTKWKKILK